jgi:hypothetical protein
MAEKLPLDVALIIVSSDHIFTAVQHMDYAFKGRKVVVISPKTALFSMCVVHALVESVLDF